MSDWFRKETWTKDDEEDFFLHLARSKTDFHKAQYLKIQAFTFYDTHNKKNFNVILTLLDKYFNDFPDEEFFRATSLHLYGRVFYDRKKYDKAFEYYQKAAYQEVKYPNVISGAWLDYAKIIIRLKYKNMYDEAEEFIQRHYASLIFPIAIYESNAVLAVIYNARGDKEKACHYKRIANEATLINEPILSNLGSIGLVLNKISFLEKAMKKIK
ncbi:MAG: tetratricopeptide repeat protein [Clostridia bacterium]|nr:tetratricopeptide repeat protein [Clostridia bacterium]